MIYATMKNKIVINKLSTAIVFFEICDLILAIQQL